MKAMSTNSHTGTGSEPAVGSESSELPRDPRFEPPAAGVDRLVVGADGFAGPPEVFFLFRSGFMKIND